MNALDVVAWAVIILAGVAVVGFLGFMFADMARRSPDSFRELLVIFTVSAVFVWALTHLAGAA